MRGRGSGRGRQAPPHVKLAGMHCGVGVSSSVLPSMAAPLCREKEKAVRGEEKAKEREEREKQVGRAGAAGIAWFVMW